ncbi:TonB-dependent receptor plug domain-containing protein [Hirschia litorea]|uniref:TonB-dependent receptor plug domain-containing protein n=1 Tax=Hirschia litorea TaxID=1199156 RepID=A0ABW2INW8_9PROT
MKRITKNTGTAIAAVLAMTMSMDAIAQDASPDTISEAKEGASETRTLAKIVVTGSNIKRSSFSDQASPIESIGQEAFGDVGAQDVRDLVETLSINAGSQNNADVFTAGYTTGTSNINLRGLGVASTLVLLNGKRQVTSSVPTTAGVLFVDTNSLVPSIAIERLEILKDGASAIYGSEAVAGVANFITRDKFVGMEVKADYQARFSDGDQEDAKIEGIVGVEGDWGNLVAAASYFDRTPLYGDEVGWLRAINGTNTSGVGSPGTFLGVPAELGYPSTGPFTPDPDCERLGGEVQAVCRFDFHDQQTVVPKENRFQGYAKYTNDLSDNLGGFAEIAFSRTRAARNTSPSYPFILDNATVPGYAPFNIFETDVRYFGRPLGTGQPATENRFENDTFRFSAGLEGSFTDDIFWEATVTKGISEGLVIQSDTITDHFIEAVAGFGGADCQARNIEAANALGVTPGDNAAGCYYWNPFGSAIDPANTTAIKNGQEIRDYIFGEQTLDAKSEALTLDFVVSGELGLELGGGKVGAAFGGQYREESLSHDYDTLSNQDAYSFLVGNPDFSASRDGWAVFAEVSLPFTDNLEVQGALRYETIDGLETTDPKIGVVYRPADWATLRGSYSTSFRAPSTFQLFGTQTTFTQVSYNGATNFISTRANGNSNLKPETSQAFNVGGTFDFGGLEFELDYTNFSFEDVLTAENAQAIINEAVANGTDTTSPKIILTPGGTIGQVVADFVNANAINTSVVDFSLKYAIDTGAGSITPFIEGTYVLEYELTGVNGNVIDGAGSRNFRNFGDPSPELRANAGVRFNSGGHNVNTYIRYIDGLVDDEGGGIQRDEQVTFDAQYSYTLDGLLGDGATTFAIGVLNAFDEDPPFAQTNGNFEARAYDPRGRRAYISLKTAF